MRRRTFILLAALLPTLGSCRTKDVLLSVNSSSVAELRTLRREEKFQDLPGIPAEEERKRFTPHLNALLDRIIEGVQQNPRRDWVLEQMDPFVAEFYLEDTELRERCISYLSRIFVILGIPDDDGAFKKYMIVW